MSPPEEWEQIERLYNDAIDLPADARKAFLDQACPAAAVRAEVESLIEADAMAGFSSAPGHLAANLLDQFPGRLSAGQRVGNYVVESLISVGGMGEVYLARDAAASLVVLKILRRHLIGNQHAVDRFQTEARAASALRHPNIVTVLESGESLAGLFIAMEWIEGRTFRNLIQDGNCGTAQAIHWVNQVAQALKAAHHSQILHRDIKPENIILRNDGVVKILDFGLARIAGKLRPEPDSSGASGTISGTLSGTLLYMSPEILRGEVATSASDVFSLGTLLYELVARQHPFAGETPLDVYEAIECRTIAAPSVRCQDMPPKIDALILRMLDRDPALRPSATELCEVLGCA